MPTKKPAESLPYNAIVQEKTKQASDFWQSSYAKKAITKTVQAMKNADAITKARNTLNPANIKAAATKTYEDVIKSPIAKTQEALKEKKEQLLDMPLPNFGLVPEALGPATNMTVREGIEAAKNTMTQIVGGKDDGGERNNDRENTKFSYINNPMNNPKVAKEVEENPDAVYGYSPKPESNLNNFKVDWTDPEEVANAQSERIKYHEKLERQRENLRNEIEELSNKGYSVEEIARIKVLQRNEGRINSYLKTNNEKGLQSMKQRNMGQYGNPDGPTPEQLFEKYGSWEKVIYASTRSNPGMDVLTGLYDIYGGK